MAKKKTANVDSNWPKVTQGSHLTVVMYPDGRAELQWDWDALVKDVDLAVKSIDNVRPDAKTAKKKTPTKKVKK